MHDLRTYDYAIVRVVTARGAQGEFVNAGIILSCDIERILRARIDLDEAALLALDATVDLELVRKALATIPAICAGGAEAGDLGKLSARERFHWLVAPRSTIVQHVPGAYRTVRRHRSSARTFDEAYGPALNRSHIGEPRHRQTPTRGGAVLACTNWPGQAKMGPIC